MRTPDTISTLNRLIRICRAGEDFCRAASGRVSSVELEGLLRRRSEEWGRLGDELQALVLLLGGDPAISGTLAARMRQFGVMLRSALLGPADATVIAVWQGIEQQAEKCYAAARDGYLPERIRRTLTLQADRVVSRMGPVGSQLGHYAVHASGT